MKFAFELIDKMSGPAGRIAGALGTVNNKLSTIKGKVDGAIASKTSMANLDKVKGKIEAAFGKNASEIFGRFASGQLTAADKIAVVRKGAELQVAALGRLAGAAVATTAALLAVGAAAGSVALAGGKLLLDAQKYRETTGAALKFQLGSAEAAQKTMGFLAQISRATGQDRRVVTEQFSQLVGSGLTTGESQQLVQLAASLKVASGGKDVGVNKLGDALLSLKRNEALTVEKSFAGLIDAGGQNRVYEALAKHLNIKSKGLDPVAIKRLVDQRLSGGPGGVEGQIRGQKAVDLFAKINLEVAGENAFGGLQKAFQATTVTGAIDLIQQRIRGLFDDANANPLATRFLGILNRVATALDPGSESGQRLLATLDRLISGAADLWDFLSPLVEAFGEGFGEGFSSALEILNKVVASMGGGDAATQNFAAALKTLGTVLGFVAVGVGSALAFLGYLEAKVAGLGAALFGAAGAIGLALVDGITSGLDSAKGKLIARLESLAALLPESVRKLLQIRSPSRVMMQLGAFSAEGFALGVERNAPSVESAARSGLAEPTLRASVATPTAGGRPSVTIAPGAVVIQGGSFDEEKLARLVEERLRALIAGAGLELGTA